MERSAGRGAVGLVLALALVAGATAHETDQFSVPSGREFADLRYYLSDKFRTALERGVASANARIASSLRDGQPAPSTQRSQRPEVVAAAVHDQFPLFAYHVEQLEFELHGSGLQARFPGRVVAYRPAVWIYHHWALLLDVTKPVRLARCSTIMSNGTYFGTDKLVHFAQMGYVYYGEYRSAVDAGASEEEAVARAVGLATGSHLLFSERTVLGAITTGVMSNGDLAANYAGLKFYRNLTEPVKLKGELRPPLLVREGPFWRLRDDVRAGTDFLSWFVSDHWDEALNPSEYVFGMATWVKEAVRDRADDVRAWYRQRDGLLRARASFERQQQELSTYYGEDYGHSLTPGATATIAECCFGDAGDDAKATASAPREAASNVRRGSAAPADPHLPAAPGAPAAADTRHAASGLTGDTTSVDRFGRGALWWAAREGDVHAARSLLDSGANANAADLDGETPLHAAIRDGNPDLVALLLEHKANVRARQVNGWEPLHLAAVLRRYDLVRLLLEHGADANAVDSFGRRALHDAASAGDALTTAELIGAGADVNASDAYGQTALHLACRAGAEPAVLLLLEAGADVVRVSALGLSPRDEARRAKRSNVLSLLERQQARTP